ncbi:MAG: hypothetical protein R6W82_03820 [bacterium]
MPATLASRRMSEPYGMPRRSGSSTETSMWARETPCTRGLRGSVEAGSNWAPHQVTVGRGSASHRSRRAAAAMVASKSARTSAESSPDPKPSHPSQTSSPGTLEAQTPLRTTPTLSG